MKIEVIIHKDNGEIRRYPAHKLVRNNGGFWTASYTCVKNGKHENRNAIIDGEKARIELKEGEEMNEGSKHEEKYCPTCHGTGLINSYYDMPDPMCPDCGGTGEAK